MSLVSVKQFLAIKPIVFNKVETKIQSGIAMISQKREVIKVPLVMNYIDGDTMYYAGIDSAILPGDAGLNQWNKLVLTLDGEEFVMCPFPSILGFAKAKVENYK